MTGGGGGKLGAKGEPGNSKPCRPGDMLPKNDMPNALARYLRTRIKLEGRRQTADKPIHTRS